MILVFRRLENWMGTLMVIFLKFKPESQVRSLLLRNLGVSAAQSFWASVPYVGFGAWFVS